MIKLEEGKYYRTDDGRKVGPARIAEAHIPDEWALWSDGSIIYEIVGLPRKDAFSTKIISEWTDDPKPWGDMSDEERGALLLAHHEGKMIECFGYRQWFSISKPNFVPHAAYRVRPEPKREAVTRYWNGHHIHRANNRGKGTHRITFDLVDGEPDCDTIKMEKIT